jgi:hypothetical protein
MLLALAAAPAWAHGPPATEPGVGLAEAPDDAAGRSMEPARPLDPGVELQRAPDRTLSKRSGVGVAEAAGVLIGVAGLAGLGGFWRRDRRVAITITAALVLGFAVETAPHLVHHALDADKGAACEVLQTAERSQAAIATLDPGPVSAATGLADLPSVASPCTLPAPAPCGRAPPA